MTHGKIRDWLDPKEYPLQKGMSKSYAVNLFKKQLEKNGIEWSKLTDKDIWYSNANGRYMMSAEIKDNG